MSNNDKLVHDPDNILEVSHLKKYFPIKGGFFGGVTGNVKAVDDVSFSIKRGTTMGLVGESGCGKSTTGRTILRLIDKTDGTVMFNGEDIGTYDKKKLRELRTKMQIIFQDPYSSLSPRLPIGEIIGEAVREHGLVSKEEYDDYVTKVMKDCGLQEYHKDRYPHEFSGGQRQRICIARALALNPEFVVCDEPVSALDVSIQAQIINLLRELQEKRNLTYLFISHDLSVVEHISDTVGVMYLGGLVETGKTEDIFGVRCMSDVNVNLYMDSKGRIVRIETPQAVEFKDSKIKSIELSADFTGEDRALDVISAQYKLNTVNGTKVFTVGRDASVTDEEYQENITLDIVGIDNTTALTMNYTNTWNLDTLAFDGALEFQLPKNTYKISADGSYQDIVEGKSYTLDLDTASFEINDEALLRIAGTISEEPGMEETEIPQSSVDLMQMDRTSIYDMFYKILMSL